MPGVVLVSMLSIINTIFSCALEPHCHGPTNNGQKELNSSTCKKGILWLGAYKPTYSLFRVTQREWPKSPGLGKAKFCRDTSSPDADLLHVLEEFFLLFQFFTIHASFFVLNMCPLFLVILAFSLPLLCLDMMKFIMLPPKSTKIGTNLADIWLSNEPLHWPRVVVTCTVPHCGSQAWFVEFTQCLWFFSSVKYGRFYTKCLDDVAVIEMCLVATLEGVCVPIATKSSSSLIHVFTSTWS